MLHPFGVDVDVVILLSCRHYFVVVSTLRVDIGKGSFAICLLIKVNLLLYFIFHRYIRGDMSILSFRFSSMDRLD